MKKRALSLLLALLLAASLLPTTALAAPDPDGCVDINEENFPDANFRTYLRDNIAHSGYADLYFTPAQLAAVKGIKAFRREIGDLTGIEYFTGLSSLYCEENQLTSLDVSKNTALLLLDCEGNRLSSLDVSKNTALQYLYCSNNELTALDVSKNTALQEMKCFGNHIETLDITGCSVLCNAYLDGTEQDREDHVQYKTDSGYLSVSRDTTVLTGNGPKLTAQPEDVTVKEGGSAVFTVAAEGEGLTYQWYVLKKGASSRTMLSGETSARLSVKTKAAMNGNKYFCVVSEGRKNTVSASAKLTVVTVPKITTQPKNASVKVKKTATFKVKATGGALKYQWYVKKIGAKKWTKVSKATKATLKVKATKKMNGWKYRCKVYNAGGYVYTKTVKLKVK